MQIPNVFRQYRKVEKTKMIKVQMLLHSQLNGILIVEISTLNSRKFVISRCLPFIHIYSCKEYKLKLVFFPIISVCSLYHTTTIL